MRYEAGEREVRREMEPVWEVRRMLEGMCGGVDVSIVSGSGGDGGLRDGGCGRSVIVEG